MRFASRPWIANLGGSLRTRSYSRIALNSIARLLPTDSDFTTIDIGTLPHYNEDIARLKHRMASRWPTGK